MASHPLYYVPEQSKWPIIASLGLLVTVVGLGTWFNDLKAARTGSLGPLIFFAGALLLAWMLFGWFGNVIRESRSGLYSGQMDRSFRWGMRWFIFSEVMFFAAFFGALFYLRVLVGPWLDGEGGRGASAMLWPNFHFSWPLLDNPDPQQFPAPRGVIDPWHLPLLNTLILLTSGTTVTWAHYALINNDRAGLKQGLWLTVILGVLFTICQLYEYAHASFAFSGNIYGATFFMATGFHGFHVFVGTVFLIICLMRAYIGDFTPKSHFGFEAAAWYWHFVDVVWLFLFCFIYVWAVGGSTGGH